MYLRSEKASLKGKYLGGDPNKEEEIAMGMSGRNMLQTKHRPKAGMGLPVKEETRRHGGGGSG